MTSDAADEATAQPVPAAFIADAGAPAGFRFECIACGWREARRVLVKKSSGDYYQTEFAACGACAAMYHWPGEVPRELAPAPGGPTMGTYMVQVCGRDAPGVSQEQLQAIQEAADRARKRRSWRARRR